MRHITPQQQLNRELLLLNQPDREALCLALVAYLRFGIKAPLDHILKTQNHHRNA